MNSMGEKFVLKGGGGGAAKKDFCSSEKFKF